MRARRSRGSPRFAHLFNVRAAIASRFAPQPLCWKEHARERNKNARFGLSSPREVIVKRMLGLFVVVLALLLACWLWPRDDGPTLAFAASLQPRTDEGHARSSPRAPAPVVRKQPKAGLSAAVTAALRDKARGRRSPVHARGPW